jgi:hypothetical protein
MWGFFLVRASNWLDKEKLKELIHRENYRAECNEASLYLTPFVQKILNEDQILAYQKKVIFLEARVAELELRLTNSPA